MGPGPPVGGTALHQRSSRGRHCDTERWGSPAILSSVGTARGHIRAVPGGCMGAAWEQPRGEGIAAYALLGSVSLVFLASRSTVRAGCWGTEANWQL